MENKKDFVIENNKFIILENKNECLDMEELTNKYTDYFDEYDYILGDYAYNKLRLKGFCDKNNKKFNNITDINTKEKYLKDLCAYECNYFLIKRVKNKV